MAGLIGTAQAGERFSPASNTIAGQSSYGNVMHGEAPVKVASTAPVPTIASPTISATPATDNHASAFDEKFKGTPLEGRWNAVKTSAEKRGISPTLVAAVMAHETGNGKNVSKNNPGGIMDPAQNWERKKQYGSINEGIDATVGTIAKNYGRAGGDLGRLAEIYAPTKTVKNDPRGLNKEWLPGVKKQLVSFGN